MDEETNKIKHHIDFERAELGRNFDEIEHRVKSATDVNAHFEKNTGLFLGAAVAGGFLLSLAFRNSSNSSGIRRWESTGTRERGANTAAQPNHLISKQLSRFSETLESILDGLVGVVSDKLQSFVADTVPGFEAKYDAIDRQRSRSSVHHMKPNLGDSSELSAVK